ncbi:MAG: tyrosine-type recombinase/integrase [Pyrinomonadaceae bacterium]|nr:tyrosine-type recombinase/integrase [Pyrinomonadaceae bacterium]
MQKFPLFSEVFRQTLTERGLSRKTMNAYLNHFRRFGAYFKDREPLSVKADEIGVFLKQLERERGFSAATTKQAGSAILFFYREILNCENFKIALPNRDRRSENAVVYFTDAEAKAVLARLHGAVYLAAALIYGSGLRLSEVLKLRVGDIDFERREIVVRNAGGARERTTFLPASLIARLEKHLENVRYVFEDDLRFAEEVSATEKNWRRQFVFPACKLSKDETTGAFRRHHLAESTIQKAINQAIRKAKISKQACSQTLRHSFAARLVENNCDVHRLRSLLGHKNLKSTLAYANLSSSRRMMFSPLDL